VLRPPQPDVAPFGAARRKTLPERVVQQVEWYLAANKLATDRFLAETAKDHDGWVPIGTLLAFPRMRKLCHPQVAAVAHVLARSEKLEISEDKTRVRPRATPHASPVRMAQPDSTSALLVSVIGSILGDANLCFDALLQASIIEFSPPEALQRGGTGVRLPVERLFAHPALAAFVRDSAASELLARLPKAGQSSVFHLSADGGFVERVKPTPEVRQLTQGVLHQRSWDRQEVKGCGVGGAASASPSDLSSPPPPPPQPHDFSVLSFNLLADMLCTCEMYPSIDTSTLDWAARLPLIQKEIAFRSPDLLCLQELQGATEGAGVPPADDHHALLRRWLDEHGYDGRYVRKTRRYGGSWPLQIGNALFWRRETFAYVCHEEVLLAAVLAAACDEESSSEYFGREPQVGLCVGLRHIKSGRQLVAITTHLSSHFQEPWRQVAQAHAVVAAGCALAEKMGEGTAVVMGADLNSIPGSGVYQLITHATLAASHPHMQHCGRADDVSMPSFGKLGGGGADLQLTMPLASAYAAVLGQEPLFTNFTGPPYNFVGTLDYIFFSPGSLRVTQVLQLPTEDTVRLERCLPSSRFPSDHLPLFAHLAFGESPPHVSRLLPTSLVTSADNSPSGSPGRPPPLTKAYTAPIPLGGSPLATGSPLSAVAPAFVCPLSVLPPAAALPPHVNEVPMGAASPKRTRDGLPVASEWAEAAARAEESGGGSGERGGERGGGEHGGGRGRGRGRRRRG